MAANTCTIEFSGDGRKVGIAMNHDLVRDLLTEARDKRGYARLKREIGGLNTREARGFPDIDVDPFAVRAIFPLNSSSEGPDPSLADQIRGS